jgi:hypothetical protein
MADPILLNWVIALTVPPLLTQASMGPWFISAEHVSLAVPKSNVFDQLRPVVLTLHQLHDGLHLSQVRSRGHGHGDSVGVGAAARPRRAVR